MALLGLANEQMIACIQAYFVTIATILGTGILGLPITLSKSGMYPFLVSFLVDAVMQSVLVHFFVDLLQRACAVQQDTCKEYGVVVVDRAEQDPDSTVETGQKSGVPTHQEQRAPSPNLHLLGRLYLGWGVSHMFDLLIIFQFMALLTCYALAGSEAYAELLDVDHFYVVPVFVWVLTLTIVLALTLVQPLISLLTFLKGSVMLAITLVTFYVGSTVGRHSHDDFAYITAPFLMGTVALGGTINTMPFTFEKISYRAPEIQYYRLAVQLGLWTCVLLNIVWCWSVLGIVPQTVAESCQEMASRASDLAGSSSPTISSTGPSRGCYDALSLESAKDNGEISTIPLTRILSRDYPGYRWVAVLVEIFIVISITVSFLTVGGALHHTLKGVTHTMLQARGARVDLLLQHRSLSSHFTLLTSLLSVLAFIVVFAIAMSDPQGFVDILEKFVSLTMNAEAGIFISLMLLAANRTPAPVVPAPLPAWLYHAMCTIPLFFIAAVVMDVYQTVTDLFLPQPLIALTVANHTVGGTL